MKYLLSILLLTFTFIDEIYAQGIVRGKITDENGEGIIGGIVALKSNKTIATNTDLEGNFSLKMPDSTAQIIVATYIGYTPKEELIPSLKKGEILIKNFDLKPTTKEIKEVTIEAKATKAKDYYMVKLKQNSATSIDFVSSETMRKTGDANVTSAVARVSGVSTNGQFITVRGIGDRYVKTTINGSRIPTLDPFTNNIKLDLFPSSLVDNIIITKTASPDLPGDFAGAYLSVETKDYPDKLTINIESSAGYNNQSTSKDILSSQRSSTDWLGYDNGFRNRSHDNYSTPNTKQTPYDEYIALGLGDFYKSLGVTESTPWNQTYDKLGLVELGLLDKGKINDAVAYQNAKRTYNELNYSSKAFEIINADAARSGQSFSNNWELTRRRAPLNFTQSFSIGNQIMLFGKPLGFLAGFKYGNSNQYDPNSNASRAYIAQGPKGEKVDGVASRATQEISRETNGWSALFNLAYKFSPNHNISLLFMPNFTGVNNVRSLIDNADEIFTSITKAQFYEQRKQVVYQYKSNHYIPLIKLKIDANASYTKGTSIAPDLKNLQYGVFVQTNESQIGSSNRYYRYLDENIFDSQISGELPLAEKTGFLRKLKLGAAYQSGIRDYSQYNYGIAYGPRANLLLVNNDINKFFATENYGFSTATFNGQSFTTINQYYLQDKSPANRIIGNNSIASTYAMVDYTIIPRLRVSGGLRIEKANIFTDVFKYDSLKYEADDERRFSSTDLFYVKPGILNEVSFLPSANIIFKLRNNDLAPINLRINYSQTVARPSMRELSETVVFDYSLLAVVFGNSELKMVQIDNYDLRLEWYFENRDNISASAFYKDFKNHIEVVQSNIGYSWQNVDKSFVQGVELEARKGLGKHLEFRANATFVQSQTNFIQKQLQINSGVKEYITLDTIQRTMFGQSPYVLNAMLTYNSDTLGLGVTVSYNVQGPRLVLVSNNGAPDIFELPRHLIDCKITKNIGKHFSTSFTVRDILNAPIRRSYKYKDSNEFQDGYSLDFDKYRFGTNYVLAVVYKF